MFDINQLGGLMAGVQQRLQEAKEEAAATVVEGQAGSGLVKVQVNGEQRVISIRIAEDLMEDREMLEDMLTAACNDAINRSKEVLASKLQAVTGGLPLPPGLL